MMREKSSQLYQNEILQELCIMSIQRENFIYSIKEETTNIGQEKSCFILSQVHTETIFFIISNNKPKYTKNC